MDTSEHQATLPSPDLPHQDTYPVKQEDSEITELHSAIRMIDDDEIKPSVQDTVRETLFFKMPSTSGLVSHYQVSDFSISSVTGIPLMYPLTA